MDLETTRLINISNLKNDIKPSLSAQKDVKKLGNILKFIITSLFVFLILLLFLIILILKSKNFVIQYLEKRKIIKDLNYYIYLQNYFCDYIHSLYEKKIEDELILYNVSLRNTSFDMFLYKSGDYISNQIQKNHYLNKNGTLNILSALQKFVNDNHIVNSREVVMLDIGAHIGWYPTYLGSFKYTILAFEPLPINYYIIKKNYCRNNRDFFGDMSSLIIINKGLYDTEKKCDYYKHIENNEKDIILCDNSKSGKITKDFEKINSVEMSTLNEFLQYIDNRNIALIRIDLDKEGEKALETGKHLFSQFHTPFIFVEFSKKSFTIRETSPKKFLQYFIDNGYQISINGFLSKNFITIEQIIKINSDYINLYLTYIRK